MIVQKIPCWVQHQGEWYVDGPTGLEEEDEILVHTSKGKVWKTIKKVVSKSTGLYEVMASWEFYTDECCKQCGGCIGREDRFGRIWCTRCESSMIDDGGYW